MAKIISPQWKFDREREIAECRTIDETLTDNLPVKWLICRLAKIGVPFKVYNLGAGVKRITTQTDVCPCCKRKTA